jgi:hypothetical protein
LLGAPESDEGNVYLFAPVKKTISDQGYREDEDYRSGIGLRLGIGLEIGLGLESEYQPLNLSFKSDLY